MPYQHRFPLQCSTLLCSVLLCSALFCSVLFCSALHRSAPLCVAPFCSAPLCTVLRCAALLRSALFCAALLYSALHCSALHCSALLCTVLLRSAPFCSAPLCTILFCSAPLCAAPLCTVLLCSAPFCSALLCTAPALCSRAPAHALCSPRRIASGTPPHAVLIPRPVLPPSLPCPCAAERRRGRTAQMNAPRRTRLCTRRPVPRRRPHAARAFKTAPACRQASSRPHKSPIRAASCFRHTRRAHKKTARPSRRAVIPARTSRAQGKKLIQIGFYFVGTPQNIVRAGFVQDGQLHDALDRNTAFAAFIGSIRALRYVQIFSNLLLCHFMIFAQFFDSPIFHSASPQK